MLSIDLMSEMFEMPDGTSAQSGRLNTRAEKMVIEREKD